MYFDHVIFFAHAVLRDWAVKSRFIFPPHLNNVSALPAKIKLVVICR